MTIQEGTGILASGWRKSEDRQRMNGPGRKLYHAGPHQGPHTLAFGGADGRKGPEDFSSLDTPFLPSIQPCTLDAATLRRHTVWNRGHAGGGEPPRGTYQGTGRCNQGQGLCNSGWRRSWLGNLGNLRGQRRQYEIPRPQLGHGQLGSDVFIVFL